MGYSSIFLNHPRIMKPVCASLLALLLVGCAASEQSGLPNVVIFLADDQGWGDVGFNGNTTVQTPNIDRIAGEGAVFSHFYVSPVCSPTRAEMLTGRYHVRSGVTSTSSGAERLNLDETTMADVFHAAGYATGAFGKWHNGTQAPYHPNARGFDEFYGFASGHWGNYFSPPLEHNGEIVRGNGYVVDDFTDKALAFIERNTLRPFLAYLPYNTPHSPMQVPAEYWDRFAERPIGQSHRDPALEDPEFTRAALAMTENIDWNVGRVLDALDSLGLADDTIVLYFSDNGPNGWRWNAGMKGRKGSTDEGGVRSPMAMRWPEVIATGTEVTQIAAAIDLLPTLADLAGIDIDAPLPLDGLSLGPALRGQDAGMEDRFIFSHWRGRTSVRSARYRLDHEGKLFDMRADPGQYHDVRTDHPEIWQSMTAARRAWETEILAEQQPEDLRPFTIGHPDFEITHLPARDARPVGAITRSNRFPNDSFFSDWTSAADAITWNVDVLAEGTFAAELYYTCPEGSEGALVELRLGDQHVAARVPAPHDPPLVGMEHDRTPRIESYVKDFVPMELGSITLAKGAGTLTLRALEIPGEEVMDFRLLVLRRVVPGTGSGP